MNIAIFTMLDIKKRAIDRGKESYMMIGGSLFLKCFFTRDIRNIWLNYEKCIESGRNTMMSEQYKT